MTDEERKAMRSCIKYLESESDMDVCGHCAHYHPEDIDWESDDVECPHRKAKGPDACVDGMIEYFKTEGSHG